MIVVKASIAYECVSHHEIYGSNPFASHYNKQYDCWRINKHEEKTWYLRK